MSVNDIGGKKLIIITDIGRDVDDSLAISLVRGLHLVGKAKLLAAIATGGAGRTRARLTRGLLRHLGWKDEEVQVAACMSQGREQCYIPSWAPPEADANISKASAAEVILKLVKENHGQVHIVCLAPITPLADALKLEGGLETIRTGLSCLWVQGQAIVKEGGRLEPDDAAFNLREAIEQARDVFNLLQDYVPFKMLGKHAAYKVSLYRKDFEAWDIAQTTNKLELTKFAIGCMNVFRTGNPELFYKLYSVPEAARNDTEWSNHVTTLSHPYDALLALYAISPELFKPQYVQAKMRHELVGNTPEDVGIDDLDMVKQQLLEHINSGVAN